MWPRLLFADWRVPLLAVTSHFSVLGTRINKILDINMSKKNVKKWRVGYISIWLPIIILIFFSSLVPWWLPLIILIFFSILAPFPCLMPAMSSPQTLLPATYPHSDHAYHIIPMVTIPSTMMYLRYVLFSTLGTALQHVAYPLHCSRCQKLGHMQTTCTSDIICP
jgi:hypothetical protein